MPTTLQHLETLPVYQQAGSGLLTDLYQLTMMYGYFKNQTMDKKAVFDLFFRVNPSGNGYVLAAGLEQVILYLHQLRFTNVEIDYLRTLDRFDEDFLRELENFRFTGTLYAVPEGTPVFPFEPILRVEGRIFELQLIESALLCFINHQSLIATKAARMVQATKGLFIDETHSISEFGLRRAQNESAAVFGARAAYLGGCTNTSNVAAGMNFAIPVSGTQAHSWIQSFESEREAFEAYVNVYPNRAILLVDTYDVLASGVINAIAVGKKLREQGYDLLGVRIDSGDLAYLSKETRKLLDAAGFEHTQIIVSDDLDEDTIRDLHLQGAPIDGYGVGTALITSKDWPALGCVYKLCAIEKEDECIPTIKVSENPIKITNPGKKKVVRFYVDGIASADLIMLDEEKLPTVEPVTLFDPVHTYKQKTLTTYTAKELLVPIFTSGQLVYSLPTLEEIRKYAQKQLGTLSRETLRQKNPHTYHVDLSYSLFDLKRKLVEKMRTNHQ